MKNAAVFNDEQLDFVVAHLKSVPEITPIQPKHYHNFYEIYYFLGSSMNYTVGNQSYHLKEHDILLIDKYVTHKSSYNPNDTNERIIIEFHDTVFDTINDKETISRVVSLFKAVDKVELNTSPSASRIHSLITNLVSNYYSPYSYGISLAKFNLVELCMRLLEMTTPELMDQCNETTPAKDTAFTVAKAVKFITENYNMDICLDNLASMLYVNKFYLCHIFKNETGLSIIDFINRKRLSEAERLLRSSDSNITEICYKVGFSSVNHFIKLFKEAYNITPKKFKDQIQQHG